MVTFVMATYHFCLDYSLFYFPLIRCDVLAFMTVLRRRQTEICHRNIVFMQWGKRFTYI